MLARTHLHELLDLLRLYSGVKLSLLGGSETESKSV